MGSTFLTHKDHNGKPCNGSIQLDMRDGIKMMAPSFSVNDAGIENLVLDIEIVQSGVCSPVFSCKRCGEEVPDNKIGTDMTCTCLVCGKSDTVNHIHVHMYLSAICDKCLESINRFNSDNEVPSHILEAMENFGLHKGMKLTSLVTVLKSPIKI